MFLSHTVHKGHEETFGGDEHVYGVDRGDDRSGVYVPNSSGCIREVCTVLPMSVMPQ